MNIHILKNSRDTGLFTPLFWEENKFDEFYAQ